MIISFMIGRISKNIRQIENARQKKPHFTKLWEFVNPDFLGGWKTRENVVVLNFLAVENFDFTRKIVKKNLGKKFVKMLWFLTF